MSISRKGHQYGKINITRWKNSNCIRTERSRYMLIKQPALLVFAGPNGSGKSTVTPYFDMIGEYSNADDIMVLLLKGKQY